MLRIRLPGVTILGRPDDSLSRVEGLFVGPEGFEGWDDGGGETRRESMERPSAHGDFDTPVFQGSKVFSIDGHALAWSEEELAHLRSQVTGVGATGDRMQVSVDHQGQTLWLMARRGAKPTFRDAGIRHGMLRAEFQLQFVAADPRKYGDVHTFSAGVPAIQYGNFPARPVFTITGTAPGGYTITGPDGRVITVTYPVVPGWPHRIDTAKGGLFVNGNRVIGGISVWKPWTIGPGLPAVTHAITAGVALQVDVTDTFI